MNLVFCFCNYILFILLIFSFPASVRLRIVCECSSVRDSTPALLRLRWRTRILWSGWTISPRAPRMWERSETFRFHSLNHHSSPSHSIIWWDVYDGKVWWMSTVDFSCVEIKFKIFSTAVWNSRMAWEFCWCRTRRPTRAPPRSTWMLVSQFYSSNHYGDVILLVFVWVGQVIRLSISGSLMCNCVIALHSHVLAVFILLFSRPSDGQLGVAGHRTLLWAHALPGNG